MQTSANTVPRSSIVPFAAILLLAITPIKTLAADVWLKNVTITQITDGDTIQVQNHDGETLKVRMACIDSPEKAQKPEGDEAIARLKQLLPLGEPVTLRSSSSRDRYNRVLAEVFVQGDPEPINLQMVREGIAPVYSDYLRFCKDTSKTYLDYEKSAKQQRIGVWADSDFVAPWVFRQMRKR